MEVLFGIAILPLICLGVMILTAVVVLFTLQRGTRAISKQLKEQKNTLAEPGSGNTRWARGDLTSALKPKKTEQLMNTCSACGGENAAGSSSCAYCGRAL